MERLVGLGLAWQLRRGISLSVIFFVSIGAGGISLSVILFASIGAGGISLSVIFFASIGAGGISLSVIFFASIGALFASIGVVFISIGALFISIGAGRVARLSRWTSVINGHSARGADTGTRRCDEQEQEAPRAK